MRLRSLGTTLAIGVTALALLGSAGCSSKVSTQPATTQVSTANAEITSARGLLGKSEQTVADVGLKDGPKGPASVKAFADAETTLAETKARLAAARSALSTSPDVAAQPRLAELEKAVALFDAAVPLGRALAIEDEPCRQAVSGWNMIADSIPLGNSGSYGKALNLGKAGRALLLKAQTALAGPAATYPASPTIKALYDWCVAARTLADIEIKMDTAGKKGRISTYNKLIGPFNKQKAVVGGRPNPGAEWNRLNDEWRTAFNKASDAYSALK